MDWIPKDESSLASSEASGDSDADADAIAIAPSAYDDDDAESCSGGGGGDSDGDGGGADDREIEERWMSWRCWMVECASEYEAAEIDDDGQRRANGSVSTTSGEPKAAEAVDAESDRLFWEACIAHGYP